MLRLVSYPSMRSEWTPYEHEVVANVGGIEVPVPANITTVNTLYDASISSSAEMDAWLEIERAASQGALKKGADLGRGEGIHGAAAFSADESGGAAACDAEARSRGEEMERDAGNAEEMAIARVGRRLYTHLFLGYFFFLKISFGARLMRILSSDAAVYEP